MLNVGEVHWFVHYLLCIGSKRRELKKDFHDRKGELKAKTNHSYHHIYSVSARYVLVTIVHFLCDIPTEATYLVDKNITRHFSYTRWCKSIFRH